MSVVEDIERRAAAWELRAAAAKDAYEATGDGEYDKRQRDCLAIAIALREIGQALAEDDR